MLNGSLTGTVSGLLASGAILIAASQVAPRVDLSASDQAPDIPQTEMPDPAPVVAETEIRPGGAAAPLPMAAPETAMPTVDTASVEVPASGTVEGALDVPQETTAPRVTSEEDGLILPPPESLRPEAPGPDGTPVAETSPDEGGDPSQADEGVSVVVLDSETPTPSLPPVSFASPSSPGLDQPTLVSPEVNTEDGALPASSNGDVTSPGAPAIEAFAVPFDTVGDRPLVGLVLLDQPDRAELDLTGLTFPITVAIDPLAPDAGARMAAMRALGFEVLALTPLPEGATPADVEVAFESFLAAVPEAVGVMDVPLAVLQESRPRAAQVVDLVQVTGHGVVTYNKGLNALVQIAEREGAPTTTVSRVFDDGTSEIAQMTRALDQGAFRSGVDGSAVLVGQLRAETLAAIGEWATGNRAETVQLAPISAVLQSD